MAKKPVPVTIEVALGELSRLVDATCGVESRNDAYLKGLLDFLSEFEPDSFHRK